MFNKLLSALQIRQPVMHPKLAGYNFSLFTMDSFVSHLETQLNRRILRIPYAPLPIGIFGFWLRVIDAPMDCIILSSDTSIRHQNQTTIHEICHIVEDHDTEKVTLDELRQGIFGKTIEQYIVSATRREDDDSKDEAQVENMADEIFTQIMFFEQQNELLSPPTSSAHLRLFENLGGFA